MQKRVLMTLLLIISAVLLISCSTAVTPPQTNVQNGVFNAGFVKTDRKAPDFLKQISETLNDNKTDIRLSADDEVFVTVKLGKGIAEDGYEGFSSVADFLLSEKGQAVLENYKAAQDNVIEQVLSLNLAKNEQHRYNVLFNGFSVKIKYGDIAKLEAIPGVKQVIISEQYAVPNVTTAELIDSFAGTGIFNNPTGHAGAGTVIAIIDTGVDVAHSAFAKMPSIASMTLEDIERILPATNAAKSGGVTAKDVYYSEKIPFGFNYADGNTEYNPDYVGSVYYGHVHGTHVAGIAAGNDEVIKGAAYDAQLAVMRVFGTRSKGAYDSDVYAAVEDCVILGVDVANLSLGSPCGPTKIRDEGREFITEVLTLAERTGLTLCCATGNDGTAWYFTDTYNPFSAVDDPDNGVVSSPASYRASLSVGSVDNLTKIYVEHDGKRILGRASVPQNGSFYQNDFFAILQGKEEAVFEYVPVPNAGSPEDYADVDVRGKIALVKRGEISFEEKVKNAAEKGAIGVIIYNNTTARVEQFGIVVGKETLPSMSITLEDGEMLAAAENKKITVNKGNFAVNYSVFSSMGALEDLSIGVDILGVGGAVYSSVNAYYASAKRLSEPYDTFDGTSMASPNTAGVMAALRGYLKEMYPYLTGAQISALAQQRLMSTATILENDEGNPYTPRRQGAGLADVKRAIETDAYLTVTGSDRTKLNLGDDKNKDGVYTLRYNLVNDGMSALTYNIKTLVFTESAVTGKSIGYTVKGEDKLIIAEKAYMLEGAEITYVVNGKKLSGTEITVEAGETLRIKVVIRLTDEHKAYMNETFPNGIYVEGYSILEAKNGVDLSIPYISFYGDWYGLPAFEPTVFDDENPTWGNRFGLVGVVWSGNIGTGWNLGVYPHALPKGYERPQGSPDKVAIGRGMDSDGRYTGEMMLGSMNLAIKRTASAIYIDFIRTDTGELIGRDVFYGVGKGCTANGGGYELSFGNFTPEPLMFANNEEILIRFSYDFNDVPVGHIDMPIYIDLEAPTLEKAEWRKEDGRTYLDLTVYDNHYLMSTSLLTYKTEDEYSALFGTAFPAYGGKGENYSYTIDVTDYMAKVVNNVFAIQLLDYAYNKVTYEIELPEEDKVETNGFGISGNKGNRELYTVIDNGDFIVYGDRKDPSFSEIVTKSSYSSNPLSQIKPTSEDEEAPEFVIEDGVLVAYNGAGGEVIVPEGVTALGDNVFSGNHLITKLVLPEGLTTIGYASIYFLKNLTEIVLPTTLETIGYYGLCILPKLTKLNLEDTNLSNVDYFGLSFLTKLESLTLPEADKPLYMEGGIVGCFNIKKLTFLGDVDSIRSSVYICNELTEVEFFGKVNGIDSTSSGDSNCFAECNKLERIVFHEEVGNIGMFDTFEIMPGWTFLQATREFVFLPSLKEVIFEKDVGVISGYAFSNCQQLSVVRFGGNVAGIGPYAFGVNPLLKGGFEITEDNQYLVRDEYGMVYDKAKTRMIKPKDWTYEGVFVVPETITEFEPYEFALPESVLFSFDVFYDLDEETGSFFIFSFTVSGTNDMTKTGLTGVKFSSEITELPEGCFFGNEDLAELDLSNIVRFGKKSLSATGITSLTISDDVEYVGEGVWRNCKNLEELNLSDKPEYESFDGFYLGTGLMEIVVPSFVDSNALSLFYGCKKLEKVSFEKTPESLGDAMFYYAGTDSETGELVVMNVENVKSIGSATFFGSGLRYIELPALETIDGVYAFSSCEKLEEVVYGDNLISFGGGYTFYDCVSLKRFYIPAKTGIIGIDGIIFNCIGLQEINVSPENRYYASSDGVLFDKELTSILKYPAASLNEEFEVPEAVSTIGTLVFAHTKNLKKIVMPSVVEIGAAAFTGSGVEIVVGENLAYVGNNAFANSNLRKIDLSNAVEIGELAFEGTNLTEITLKKAEYIGNKAFGGISTLQKVTLGGVGEFNFARAFYGSNVKEIVLDDCEAFALENNFFTNGTKTVLYRYLGTDEKVMIPEGIVKIESDAFRGNMNLKSLELPKSLRFIGDGAFYGCGNLKEITFKSEKAPILQSYFRENARYLYNQFVMNLDDTEKPLEITVYCNGDKSFMTPIWKMYFRNIVKMS